MAPAAHIGAPTHVDAGHAAVQYVSSGVLSACVRFHRPKLKDIPLQHVSSVQRIADNKTIHPMAIQPDRRMDEALVIVFSGECRCGTHDVQSMAVELSNQAGSSIDFS